MKNIEDLTLDELEHLTPKQMHEMTEMIKEANKVYDEAFIPKRSVKSTSVTRKPIKRFFND